MSSSPLSPRRDGRGVVWVHDDTDEGAPRRQDRGGAPEQEAAREWRALDSSPESLWRDDAIDESALPRGGGKHLDP